MKISPSGEPAMGVCITALLLTLMQEVYCCKLLSALSPYCAERLVRGGIFPPSYHYHHHVLSTQCWFTWMMMHMIYYHGCLQFSLAQMPISLLPWMPAILLTQKEVI